MPELKAPAEKPAINPEIANLLNGSPPSLDTVQQQTESLPDIPETAPETMPDAWGKQLLEDAVVPTSATEVKPAAVKPPPGFVPHQALEATRSELKDAQEKIARMNQRFEDTIRLMQGQRPQSAADQQQKPPTLPDPEQEPVKHMQQRFDRIEQALNGLIGMQQQGMGQAQTVQAIQADEMAFKAKHNDYDRALDYVRGRRAQELTEVMGFSPQQAAQTLANEEMMISMNALKRGESPAQVAYKLAERWGYKNGATMPDQNAQQVQVQADKLKAAAEAMQTNRSLGNVSGVAPTEANMTLEALANLEGDAFVKAFNKLMGGSKTAKSQIPAFLNR